MVVATCILPLSNSILCHQIARVQVSLLKSEVEDSLDKNLNMAEMNSTSDEPSDKPSAGSHLPQELIDHIIDAYKSDKRTLLSCSLTAKSWVERSSYHLFRLIHLPAHNGMLGMLRRSERFSLSVRKLKLQDIPGDNTFPFLRDVVDALPYLEHLILWGDLPGTDTSLLRFESGKRHIKTLHVAWLSSSRILQAVLSIFSSIDMLILHCGYTGRDAPLSLQVRNIRNFVIKSDSEKTFVELSSLFNPEFLSSVSIDMSWMNSALSIDVAALDNFLHITSRNIEELEYVHPAGEWASPVKCE